MSQIVTTPTEMAPAVNHWEINGNTFVRSQSMPPERRKQRVKRYVPKSSQAETPHIATEKDKPDNEYKDVTLRRSKNWYGGMSFRGRKSDVRVSTINPDQFLINNDIKTRLQNGGNSLLQNGAVIQQHSNGLSELPSTKAKNSTSNGLVKMLQSVRRISSFAEKNGSIHTKTVEIDRSESASLGIFIKKRKVRKHSENGAMRQGIFVSRLDPSCKVSRDNLLHIGDQILSINNVEIIEQDVKLVAGMMCLPKRLVLKIRSSHKFSNRPYIVPRNPQLQRIVEGKSIAPNLGAHDTAKFPSAKNKTATLNSMYDNDRVAFSASTVSKGSVRNSVQIRFDESYQILMDAIADCDKPKNINNNSSSKITDITNIPETLNENFASDLFSSETTPPEIIPDDYNSLLNEILNTISGQEAPQDVRLENSSTTDKVVASNLGSHPCTSDANSVHFLTNLKMIDDPDYDEVPTTDDESLCSYNEEVSVDALGNHLKKYTQLNKSQSTSTSSSSVNSQGVEPLLTPHQTSVKVSSLGSKLFGNTDEPNSSNLVMHRQTCSKMPRFPVAHTDFSTSECGCVTQPPEHVTNSITVDKKRHWLFTGPQVSDELQKRLDGSTPTPKEGKQKEGKTRKISTGIQKSDDAKSVSKRRDSCKRRTSESSNTSSHSSNSPGISRSNKSSLDSPSSVSDFIFHRKNSLKNQNEKSAKSLLSVTSPPSPSPKPFVFADKSTSQDPNVEVPMQHNREVDTGSFVFEKASMAKQVSPPILLDNDQQQESTNQGTSNPSAAVKITSPSRSRRKNWSKKITKKFKIGSSSENPMSEYTCWTVEEEQKNAESKFPSNHSRVSTQHNLQKIINKSDSAVLNRYHLDISMAHQRRLSRQLEWDNVLPDPSIKALSPSQFKKYKPVPVTNHLFLPAIDGCLVITLYGVRELKKTLCEAYCLVQVDNATTKRIGTTMQTCRGAVAWNQCFELMVNKARDLHVTLYTWETRGGKHKISSYATLNLPSLIKDEKLGPNFSERLAVRLEPRGTLYIKVALEQNPSHPGPLVFGADLQSIVDRENIGYGIPALVHCCIEEVEKRGMQVVGIYRLCGSAIVKRELRRKVEEAKGEMPLTSDHYPDVNVITGILKDFLRELPQPLFPPELLEAVTMAMEKNPGPTPNTVVKEPFAPDPSLTSSIVSPQVPSEEDQKQRTNALLQHIKLLSAAPAERATLYALLNHLKKVAMHHDQNKMTCQNLAVCFGPVLLGPVNAQLGNGIDLSAAIGFKRHIQVLNYMLSNWPTEPVAVPRAPSPENSGNRNSVNRMSCVSLTRRLSRVFVVDGGEAQTSDDVSPGNVTEKRGTLISMGRSESLNSILETSDQFTDPKLDMRNLEESEDL